jgi:4-hydroxybenzoate polyprenyltransferase
MLARLGRAATVVHPVPSALDAAAVAALALVAGASPALALTLAVAMLGFQFAIGALNDVVDADVDRLVKPAKPIPAGIIAPSAAIIVAVIGASVGLAISFGLDTRVGILGAAGLATGLAYDLIPRRWGLAWLCFVPAFPLLLAWTWIAATGELPPAWPLLFVVAGLAGPMINLANGLVDREADERTGRTSLAVALGARRGWLVLVGLTAIVHGLAWAALLGLAPRPLEPAPLLVAMAGTLLSAGGLVGSAGRDARAREGGFLLSALGLGTLGVAWVAAMEAAT